MVIPLAKNLKAHSINSPLDISKGLSQSMTPKVSFKIDSLCPFLNHFADSLTLQMAVTGEYISLADDLKAAATDSIKKCASLLGVGLHLYNGDKQSSGQNHKHNQRPYSDQGHSTNYQNHRSRSKKPGNGNGNARLSSRQFKYIMRLADEAGRSKEELDQETLQMFGSAVQFLSKADASVFIDNMLSK